MFRPFHINKYRRYQYSERRELNDWLAPVHEVEF